MNWLQAEKDVMQEYMRATRIHGHFTSAHEGLAVILEEFAELQDEVFKRERDVERLRKEACQLSAMAMRFIVDIT